MTPGDALRNAASASFERGSTPKTVFLQDNSSFLHHHPKETQ